MNKITENANAPELTITPPQPLLDLQYNPRDQHILVGGLMNGQVSLYSIIKPNMVGYVTVKVSRWDVGTCAEAVKSLLCVHLT